MLNLKKMTLTTFITLSAHILFAQQPPANPLQKERKRALDRISSEWNAELKRRKYNEKQGPREKNKPAFSYEATNTSRMPKVINEVLQPLKEIQQQDLQNPAGKSTQEMPKRLTKKQREALEEMVRGAGLAYEILSLDDALAEINVLKPKTAFEKRTEALRLHQEDTSFPFNKALEQVEDQTEELEAATDDQKAAEIARLSNKSYADIEEQTLSYMRNKAFKLTSDEFFKKRDERAKNAEPRFKKLLSNSFDTVIKGKSLGEQKEKELHAARLAARFSQSKDIGKDSALAQEVIATSEIIRELQSIASDKKLSGEARANRIINIEQRIAAIKQSSLKEAAEKTQKKLIQD